MPVIRTSHGHAGILVGDDGQVAQGAALDVVARFGQLGDLVTAAVVDEDLAETHLLCLALLFSRCLFYLWLPSFFRGFGCIFAV